MSYVKTTQAQHRERMLDPKNWPYWPWLPIKRIGHDKPGVECGVIYADDTEEGKPVTVYFDKVLNPSEPKEYTDVDAVLDDGWVVD